ncbi:MAG TPA: galactose-1-phosphate uridylyltransferase [Ruminococcaceae bacterium]|nr:galactose-1-phosphate uridylyltransferase [Oscillospiraceae bacterium]
MIYKYINSLTDYGIKTGLIPQSEKIYARNLLLEAMGEQDYKSEETVDGAELCEILSALTDIAAKRGLAQNTAEGRDIFDTKLMNCLVPRPSQIQQEFYNRYNKNPEAATDYFYKLSQDSNYIRRDRVRRDRKWKVQSEYGEIDITINLSKPEKDPRDIAAALKHSSAAYPKCQLCVENEGYSGRIGHPARANHRVIPVSLGGEEWFLQYSPYVYYNEHCIAFNSLHTPMKINRQAFEKLFDFVTKFPHYFIGSNADLPIVGGSILTHDHFQGGHYTFAMEKAEVERRFTVKGFEDVDCGVVKWPLSVIRLTHESREKLTDLAEHILNKWRNYTDEAAMIYAFTDGVPHNTVTPIARRRGERYEIDLCLRNNLTTDEHPMGLFHPHAQRHHIKKENIGLIEVMGLAVLPSRLQKELQILEAAIHDGDDISQIESVEKHAKWARTFAPGLKGADVAEIRRILEQEVGKVFLEVLCDAGVYKRTPGGAQAFDRFIAEL